MTEEVSNPGQFLLCMASWLHIFVEVITQRLLLAFCEHNFFVKPVAGDLKYLHYGDGHSPGA
jgi:hypothetical protein